MFLGRTVAPVNPVWFAQLGNLFNPTSEPGMPGITCGCLDFYRSSSGHDDEYLSGWTEARIAAASLKRVDLSAALRRWR